MSTNYTYCYSLHQMVVGWFRRSPVNPLSFIAPSVKVDGDSGTYDYFPQGYAFRRVDTSRGRHQSARSLDLVCTPRPFALEDHSLRIGIDDQDLHLSREELDARRSEVAALKAEARTGTLLGVWQRSMIADGFDHFRSQVQARSGVGNWSSSSADPMKELKDEIDRMVKEAEAHAAEDKAQKESIEVRNNADSLVYQSEKTIKDLGDKADKAQVEKVQAAAEKVKEALKGTDNEAIKKATEELQKPLYEMSAAAYQSAQQAAGAQGAPGAGAQEQAQGGEKKDDDNVVDAEYTEVKDDKK